MRRAGLVCGLLAVLCLRQNREFHLETGANA